MVSATVLLHFGSAGDAFHVQQLDKVLRQLFLLVVTCYMRKFRIRHLQHSLTPHHCCALPACLFSAVLQTLVCLLTSPRSAQSHV